MIKKLERFLFYFVIVLLPVNLGFHFDIKNAFVNGILIDYLQPVVFVQDIAVVLLIACWLFLKKQKNGINLGDKSVITLIFFEFSLLLSSISAFDFIPSIYLFLRFFIYGLFALYILSEINFENVFFTTSKIFGVLIFLISVLGIFQYIKQGSVFNNYLIFGEQPYTSSTWGISHENFLGESVVPSYGLFRHPNIFGGFLSLTLLWVVYALKKSRFYWFPILAGIVCLFLTFSYSSWLVFLFGLFSIFALKNISFDLLLKSKKLLLYFTILLSVFLTLIVFTNSLNPSIYRRSALLNASIKMIEKYPLFGVGLNNFTLLVDKFSPNKYDLRFTQPVHNIFALLWSESGLFSLLFFIGLFYLCIKKQMKEGTSVLLLINLLQMLLLGSVDHYFLTIHQTFLLMMFIFGLSLSSSN